MTLVRLDRRHRWTLALLALLIVPFSSLSAQTTADDFFESGLAKQGKGDFDGAIEAYAKAIELGPDNAVVYMNRGVAKFDKGDLDGAFADYAKAIELEPDNAEPYVNRGNVKASKGDHDGAIADYAKAIELKPDFSVAYNNRGNSKHAKGDLDGAIADYAKAIELKPGYARAYNNRGNAETEKGDLDGAIADFDKAIELKYDAYSIRGLAKLVKGDDDGAVADFDQAIRRPNAYAHFYRSLTLRQLHRGDPSSKLSAAAAKWEAGWPKTVALYLTGKLAEADFLAQAGAGDAKTQLEHQCEAFYYAGMTHLLKKESAAARKFFDKSVATNLKTSHEFTLARAELARLPKARLTAADKAHADARLPENQSSKDMPAIVRRHLEGIKDYQDLSRMFDNNGAREGKGDDSWKTTAAGLAAGKQLEAMRTDAAQVTVEGKGGSRTLQYSVGGRKVTDAGIAVWGLDSSKGYREKMAGAVAQNIVRNYPIEGELKAALAAFRGVGGSGDNANADARLPENESSKDMPAIVRRHLEGNKDYQDLSRMFDNNGAREGKGDDSWKTTAAGLAAGKRLEGMRRDAMLAEVKTNGGSRALQYSLNGHVVGVPISVSSLDNTGYRENMADKIAQNIVNYWVGVDLKAADNAEADARPPENESSKDMPAIVRRHLEGIKDYRDLSRMFENNGAREGKGDDSWKTTAAGLAAGKQLEAMRRDATLAEVKTNGRSRALQYSVDGQVVGVPISVHSLDSNAAYRENIAEDIAVNIVNYYPVGADLKAALAVFRGGGDSGTPDTTKPTEDQGKAGIQWVRIPGGTFTMGTTDADLAWSRPTHSVTIKSFQMAKTLVTNKQYKACVAAGACTAATSPGAQYEGDDQPVVGVDWNQAKSFSTWAGGRLPTESEWEYAARSGGKDWKYPWGNEDATCANAVISGCGYNATAPVCSKSAGNTQQGLCDMAGNAWEWVEDWFHASYNGAPTDGSAWEDTGSGRVNRGGSWRGDAGDARSAYRSYFVPGFHGVAQSFRPVR